MKPWQMLIYEKRSNIVLTFLLYYRLPILAPPNLQPGIIAPGLIGHRPQSMVPPEMNIAKAREYLAAAGLSDGSASHWTY